MATYAHTFITEKPHTNFDIMNHIFHVYRDVKYHAQNFQCKWHCLPSNQLVWSLDHGQICPCRHLGVKVACASSNNFQPSCTIEFEVHRHYLVAFHNRTPILDWCVVRWGSKNKHHEDTCLKEIKLHLQNLCTSSHSIMNTIGRPMYSMKVSTIMPFP